MSSPWDSENGSSGSDGMSDKGAGIVCCLDAWCISWKSKRKGLGDLGTSNLLDSEDGSSGSDGMSDKDAGIVCCLAAGRISWRSEWKGLGDVGTSAIWSNPWDSENGPSGGDGMSDKDTGIVAEGDWLLEPAREVLDKGEERCPIADLLSACIGLLGDGFIHVGVSGCTKPTRRFVNLSR